MEEDIVWEIGEIEAQGGGESPPLFDQATPPPLYPPASVSSLTRGDAAAASISNKRGRVAASSKAIQGLREVTAPPTDGSDDDCCAICLQDLDYSDKAHPVPVRAMPCSHTFHEHCIFEWLRRNAVCPLCRHQLPTEDDHEQDYADYIAIYAQLTWSPHQECTINYEMVPTYSCMTQITVLGSSRGQWNSVGSCDKETEPIANEQEPAPYTLVYLNTTKMSDYRKEVHPSVYRKQKLTEEERTSPDKNE
ncbi:RING-H2 finger protein ATL58-like [Setaria italica]|uniref:RING-H2 finger protein ATL58-like n=1 Tax=Setaria italica TaxID=4555 RepID=UPI000BE5EDCC|nr:RING-H2 finger protein ATL58-like [Setaria italica]